MIKELPLEINNKILFFINDTNTYLKSRLVCKSWYEILKNIYIFSNLKKTKIIEFTENKIIKKDINNNKILEEIIFYSLGYYKLIKYIDDKKIIIDNQPPYKLNYEETQSRYYIRKSCDIRDDEMNVTKTFIPSCTIS